jgi:hypothetical protein
MLLTNIDHWDLFTISEDKYLLFPRFKKDYFIGIKDLYYHKGRNYLLQRRNNTENIKNIRFNVVPYFKHLRNSSYMFMPCWNLYSHRPITPHQLTLEITGISFLEDMFCKFIDLGINTTPLINLYPSGFCDGIRIDRSTIIGKRFDDLCDFGKIFSDLMILYQPSLNFLRVSRVMESVNLGWLNKYSKESIDKYETIYKNDAVLYTVSDLLIRRELYYLC